MPRDKQARKGVTILVGIIDLDHEEEVGLLERGEKEICPAYS